MDKEIMYTDDEVLNDMVQDMTDNLINIARTCHNINKAYCEGHGDFSQVDFDKAPDWQQSSAIEGVLYAMNNPDATPEDVHNSWMQSKLDDGWSYGKTKDPEAKTHPCLVEYEKLPLQQRIKDSLFSLCVKSFLDKNA
jgi:hypothetical protein